MSEAESNRTTITDYEQLAEYWDGHSVADVWNETEPAEFELAPQARRRYLVALDRDLLARVHRLARERGLSTESLVNLLVEQRLNQLESRTA